MSVIHKSFIGAAEYLRYVTVIELPLGLLMRERRLISRIRANELSYEFVREIAESTLPFQNVADLLRNVVSRHKWTTESISIKTICQMVIQACDQAADKSKPPLTGATLGQDCWDATGEGIKRYPHTYECILRPYMEEPLREGDCRKDQRDWEHRIALDGSPSIMGQRVRDAREGKPRTYYPLSEARKTKSVKTKDIPF